MNRIVALRIAIIGSILGALLLLGLVFSAGYAYRALHEPGVTVFPPKIVVTPQTLDCTSAHTVHDPGLSFTFTDHLRCTNKP